MAVWVLGICGGSGSGKTTLTTQFVELVGPSVVVLPLDNYYRDLSDLTSDERGEVDFDDPSAIDGQLFRSHLAALAAGESVEVPVYDFSSHVRTGETARLGPAEVVVAEGITLLGRKKVVELLDHSVFIDVPEEIRFERRLRRDMAERGRTEESVRVQWEASVAPGHDRWVQPFAGVAHSLVSDPTMDELWHLAADLAAKMASRGSAHET